ncbi:MAG TPA: type I glyceraldehyde-3-phosphate dehydrogenase [Syntrophomonadaceae bacterium]|nr:type I glyceraldehyde-3-phosphate dehydrogenase [Syntrophomonadaceae bacterium]
MAVKVGINGFGRIGRLVLRNAMQRDDIEVVAVNDLGSLEGNAHLFKYDSVHGIYKGEVEVKDKSIIVDGKEVRYLNEKDPAKLPWKEMGVQVVVEGTGVFRSKATAGKHIEAGASKVIITAPGKDVDITMVMGVNQEKYDSKFDIVSNASCTTNCLAPVAKILLDEFGIVKGLMTTIHSFTNDQRVLDLEHSDFRRARAASMSLIPTTTGAAAAVGLVIPELKGKLDGMAIRVPTPNVSMIDLTLELEKSASVEAINQVFKHASETNLKGILKYTEIPLVSNDYIGESHSAVVDGLLTMTMGDKMAKVIAWYDNEWGYSVRVVDAVVYLAQQGL